MPLASVLAYYVRQSSLQVAEAPHVRHHRHEHERRQHRGHRHGFVKLKEDRAEEAAIKARGRAALPPFLRCLPRCCQPSAAQCWRSVVVALAGAELAQVQKQAAALDNQIAGLRVQKRWLRAGVLAHEVVLKGDRAAAASGALKQAGREHRALHKDLHAQRGEEKAAYEEQLRAADVAAAAQHERLESARARLVEAHGKREAEEARAAELRIEIERLEATAAAGARQRARSRARRRAGAEQVSGTAKALAEASDARRGSVGGGGSKGGRRGGAARARARVGGGGRGAARGGGGGAARARRRGGAGRRVRRSAGRTRGGRRRWPTTFRCAGRGGALKAEVEALREMAAHQRNSRRPKRR